MRTTTCLGIALFALLAPGAMAADNCAAPPGTSGIDQYCESLPTPGSGSHHGGKGNGPGGDRVPAGTRNALKKQGDAGAAVLALTQSSQSPAPASATHRSHRRHRSHAAPQQKSLPSTPAAPANHGSPAPDVPASNPVSAVGNSFGGSLGAGFLVLLGGLALVMGAVAWLGRRRRPEPS